MISFILLIFVSSSLCSLILAQEGTKLAGYTFESDVSEHANLDLDQQSIEKLTDEAQWKQAEDIYRDGKNSKKSNSTRSLKGFSSEADNKLDGEGYFELYKKYYDGQPDYADQFVTAALQGTGDFKDKPDKFRAECANKGSQYQNVWMYVIHELEDAINDCTKGNLEDNDKSVKAWDEAWAFYAGSLEGENGSKDGEGLMLYALAQKRCKDFDTCEKDGVAKVNTQLLALFKSGRTKLNKKDCDDAIEDKNSIVQKMTIPVIQGALRYVVLAKDDEDKELKQHGEGLAFSRAFLPILDHCKSSAADKLFDNFKPDANPAMKDSIDSVAEAIYEQLGCMGIKCDDIGSLEKLPECKTNGDFKPVANTDKAVAGNDNKSSGGVSGGTVAGVVIGIIVAIIVIGAIVFFFIKNRSKKAIPVPTDIGADGDFA